MSTQQYVATYGVNRMRGGWLITEQMIINSRSEESAWTQAKYHCKRGEYVYSVEPIQ